jgi:energy-coupling factor transporter transmembrane protein EcfT
MVIDPSNLGILLIFTLITVLSAFLPQKLFMGKSPETKIWLNNISICSFWFVIGFFIFKVTTSKDVLDKIPYSVFLITFAVLVIMFSFSAFVMIFTINEESQQTRKSINEYGEKVKEYEKLLVSNSSGIKDFNSLLGKIISENPDVVIIAGNLLSMSTSEGANLVNKYLNQSTTNVIKLLIPASSKSLLSTVKTKINTSVLDRLEVFVADPFWFLQGIVILGRRRVADNSRIDPYGCIFYKIKMSVDDENSKEGIYIDLKNNNAGEIKDSFAAYYSLLNSLEYTEGAYTVKKTFTKKNSTTNKNEAFLAKKQIFWETI